ncbi:MAG: chemotaxis response regulator protein-glutamate methylesterase [Myxococcales bacterium]|nr:chemotaxis response regulator protein-glutamate methylesterase [Myxococcales bacterium]
MSTVIKVLIVDDSALVRGILERGLSKDPELRVVGTAHNPYEARDLLVELSPDVMTLDVEMPRMDGVTFIKKFMAVLPTPTVVLSSLTTRGSTLALQALEAGAVDVMAKPSSAVAGGLEGMMEELIRRVKVAARARVARKDAPVLDAGTPQAALDNTTDAVIGLGASTGGVAALTRILPVFPGWSPGVVVVQHMPAGFTRDFADRLSEMCKMKVSEAREGDRVLRGHILVGPGGDKHVEVRRFGGEYRITLTDGPPVSGHRPSVDVFFRSLAKNVGKNAAACLLTGMGEDGASGLKDLRLAGGRTFAQDQETSAVWGMPAAAAQLGAAERLLPLQEVPRVLVNVLSS